MSAKKAGGGKLTRSETVTVRLDPKLRYLAELCARKHRRTLSSFIEWAIDETLKREEVWGGNTFEKKAEELWDVREANRVLILAFDYPYLMTHEEQVLTTNIFEHEGIWLEIHKDDIDPPQPRSIEAINMRFIHAHWEDFKAVAKGERGPGSIPPAEHGFARKKFEPLI